MNKEDIDYAIKTLIDVNTEKIKLIANNLTDKQYNIYLLGYFDALLATSFVILTTVIGEALKDYEKNKKSEQALFLILSHLLSEK
jgi:hypothetical protein